MRSWKSSTALPWPRLCAYPTGADQQSGLAVADWIAWQLEEAGYTGVIQTWVFRPAFDFVANMRDVRTQADRTLVVLSPD